MKSRSNTFQAAKYYQSIGWSVIQTRQDKRALRPWKKYQEQRATMEELKEWFSKTPDANIAIVTGAISGITVVDVDSKEGADVLDQFLPDNFQAPIVDTPGGGFHVYFQYVPGIINKARILKGCDVRNDGGYCLAPTSKNGRGKAYRWRKDKRIDKVPLPEMPGILRDTLLQDGAKEHYNKVLYARVAKSAPTESGVDRVGPRLTTLDHANFTKGRRDESIFHVAYQLAKSNTDPQTIKTVLDMVASCCNPPYDPRQIPVKINSAINRAKNHELDISGLVDEFLETTLDDFLTTDVHRFVGLTTLNHAARRKAQKAIIMCLKRRTEEGVIEPIKGRGRYRKINTEVELLDITAKQTKDIDIWLPLGIHKMIRVMPGNILAIAGSPDSGKTAFCLSTCRHNFKKMRVRYLSSEMGVEEARDRIEEFDIDIAEWQKNWEFIECYDNYQDLLLRDEGCLTIIDYLEQAEGEAYKAGHQLAQIHKKLGKGVALVAIQKQRGARDTGYGGEITLQKPRFYMAMDMKKARIVKAKIPNREFGHSTGMECTFNLGVGSYFYMDSKWSKPK